MNDQNPLSIKWIIIGLAAIFLFLPKVVLAQVVINEFSSGTTSDWVEIFNKGELKEISSLKLVDNAGNEINFPSCLLNTNGTYALNWSNRLDNAGDRISLIEGGITIDCVSYGSGPACEGRGIDLPAMTSSEFGAREPEGTGSWVKKTSSTKSDNSYCVIATPTPTPTPTVPAPTPTPTPAPKATYKINEVKDKDGNKLSSVQIYVDGVYVHHYAPETLTFCDGCKCDTYVDCGFGEHTIELQKSGYQDWEEKKNFSAGANYEVNPVMEAESTNSGVTSTPTPTPTPTKKPTPTPTPNPTPTGEILSEATPSAEETTPTPEVLGQARNPLNLLPKILIGLGILLLAVSGGFLLFPKIRGYNKRKDEEIPKIG